MGAGCALTPAQEGAQAPRRAPAVEAPGLITSERYPRRLRLARGSDLTACWNVGRRRRAAHLDLAWRPNARGHRRCGVIVPRFQRTAVARNRLRRRLREILRRGPLQELPAVDLVIRARRSAYDASFAQLRADVTRLVSRVT